MLVHIRFGDNDFHRPLYALGEFLLKNLTVKILQEMENRGELQSILTDMFRSFVVLHSHRYDMYTDWYGKGQILERNEKYLNDDDYKLDNITFIEVYPEQQSDGGNLLVDFTNKQVLTHF